MAPPAALVLGSAADSRLGRTGHDATAFRFRSRHHRVALDAGTGWARSAQGAGTYFCTARDASRMAGFVSQLFNMSQADAAKVTPAWITAIKMYGVTPSTPPTCQGFAKFADADSARNQFIAFVTNSLEQRIDKMNWTYSGASVARGDAPSSVASGPSGGG